MHIPGSRQRQACPLPQMGEPREMQPVVAGTESFHGEPCPGGETLSDPARPGERQAGIGPIAPWQPQCQTTV